MLQLIGYYERSSLHLRSNLSNKVSPYDITKCNSQTHQRRHDEGVINAQPKILLPQIRAYIDLNVTPDVRSSINLNR